jgi:Flp pilus assembly pilin Flp
MRILNVTVQVGSFKAQTGATFVEYMLLLMLVALVAVSAIKYFGEQVEQRYSGINSAIDAAQ